MMMNDDDGDIVIDDDGNGNGGENRANVYLCLKQFLDASAHLYKRLCPSVSLSVGDQCLIRDGLSVFIL